MGIDAVQEKPDHEPVVVAEPTRERLGQLRDLGAHTAVGQIGQHFRVTLPGHERLEHGLARNADNVGGHRGELDAGIFEQLLQALDLLGPFGRDDGPHPGQRAQFTDGRWRHERGPYEPVGSQIGQPSSVADIFSELKNCKEIVRIMGRSGGRVG